MAAYSTVRALYHGYFGPMYQVTRASDGSSKQIWTSRPGGYAAAAAQTAFCAGTTCTISRIYDQSGHGNTLGIEPIGGNGSPDVGAIANALPVTIDGHLVTGSRSRPGSGTGTTSPTASRPAASRRARTW